MDARVQYVGTRLCDLFRCAPQPLLPRRSATRSVQRSASPRSLRSGDPGPGSPFASGLSPQSPQVAGSGELCSPAPGSSSPAAAATDTLQQVVDDALCQLRRGAAYCALDSWLAGGPAPQQLCFWLEGLGPDGAATAGVPLQLCADPSPPYEARGRLVWLLRNTARGGAAAVSRLEQKMVSEVVCDAIDCGGVGGIVAHQERMLRDVYTPMVHAALQGGGAAAEGAAELHRNCVLYHEVLAAAISPSRRERLQRATPPDPSEVQRRLPGTGPFELQVAARDPDVSAMCGELCARFTEAAAEALRDPLYKSPEMAEGVSENLGPLDEITHWRERLAKLRTVHARAEHSGMRGAMFVLQSRGAAAGAEAAQAAARAAEALKEAQEYMRFLGTLEGHLGDLYSGPPRAARGALPGLLRHLHMMLSLSHYFTACPEHERRVRATFLLCLITNRVIVTCKAHISDGGRLWDQAADRRTLAVLVGKLAECKRLCEAIKTEYSATRADLQRYAHMPQFDFGDLEIFGRLNLFSARIDRLEQVFQDCAQYRALAAQDIAGMEHIYGRFAEVWYDLRIGTERSSGGLLDYKHPGFDREFHEFRRRLAELESTFQVFINSKFENVRSTEQALTLLRKLELAVTQEHLLHDLRSKYIVVFHNYGLDLEHVWKLFDRQRKAPPVGRNSAPAAGAIQWARLLLRRIEGPMQQFAQNRLVMSNLKDSKKIVRLYNRVARGLVDFEQTWLQAWRERVDVALGGLQATLLVRHEDGRLFVNFDPEILALMSEARSVALMGGAAVELPHAARSVLLRGRELKQHSALLAATLGELEATLSSIPPVAQSILRGAADEVSEVLRPGETALTWTSLNVGNFIARVQASVGRLHTVGEKVSSVITGRMKTILQAVAASTMVEAAPGQTYSLAQFASLQERRSRQQEHWLGVKARELERAADEVLETASLSAGGGPSPQDAVSFKTHFHELLYTAILSATTCSLGLLKSRVGAHGKSRFGAGDTFFSLDVELEPPHVMLNPSLEEVQKVVNSAATAVLGCSKTVAPWGGIENKGAAPFHEEVARDKGVVKVVLLLTGGVHGLKRQVLDYLESWHSYEFLWAESKADAYAALEAEHEAQGQLAFVSAVDAALQHFLEVETELEELSSVQCIGALQLSAAGLLGALRASCLGWRKEYARRLHDRAQRELRALMEEMEGFSAALTVGAAETLQELQATMDTLEQVRRNETAVDARVAPVSLMYTVLARPEYALPPVPPEELERLIELGQTWQRVRAMADSRADEAGGVQQTFRMDLVHSVQKFTVELITFRNDFEENGPMVRGIPPEQAMARLRLFSRQLEDKLQRWETLSAGERLFGMPPHRFPELARTAKEISHLEKLYTLYVSVRQRIKGYESLLWDDLLRSKGFDRIEDECRVFQSQCKALPKALKQWEAFRELEQTIEDFSAVKPLLQCLASEHMHTRHWKEIMQHVERTWSLDPGEFKLKDLLDANIVAHADVVEDVALKAEKEHQIDAVIRVKIEQVWAEQEFEFDEWRGRGELLLKGDVAAEIREGLEESQMLLAALNPRFLEPFKDTVKLWMVRLNAADRVVTLWLEVQQNWQAMEAVFSGGDITKQMPVEAKKFHQIDKQWVKLMQKAREGRNVIHFCQNDETLPVLGQMRDGLEGVQRQLAAYLESKKRCFPRFYFVADKELLEILSQASEPHAIQAYAKKLFDGVEQLRLETVRVREPGREHSAARHEVMATWLYSPEGERLKLETDVPCRGHVEEWLGVLVEQMKRTVRGRVQMIATEIPGLRKRDSPPTYFSEQGFRDILAHHPAQIVLLGIQMLWSLDVTDWITTSRQNRPAKTRELGREDRRGEGRLNALLTHLINTTKGSLQPKDRTNVETLITVHIHQTEIWHRVILPSRAVQRDRNAFDWLMQVRVYYAAESECALISICDTDTEYSNEYLGVKERLVITPLTDRCYITLSQALSMKMGGAPAGPAGTGKTETTKDLGRMCGVYVVVFNCSDQMDRGAVGRIIKGLAQANAWGCFDEFNRIELPVLSVVAQQIECVLKALKEHRQVFRFVDDQVYPLAPGVGYFITMNPGYAGRQELPENLKVLFRGVTMMVPGRQIIIKVKLAASGYSYSDTISEKFSQLYELCENQLSKQRHYDFGLRNILSVLRSSGERLRRELARRGGPASGDGQQLLGQQLEERLFMRTLLDMNLSKLVAGDVALFHDLLRDMFPGREPDSRTDAVLHKELRSAWAGRGLLYQLPEAVQPLGLALKAEQLAETMNVRHGIMVVGPAGSGKSAVYSGLRLALCEMHGGGRKRYEMWRMFPKAITAQEMFGRLDKATGDWYDGVFSALWKRAVGQKHNVWICADGPVDAIWIENLNTVLDDNRLLTLAGGDRIPMTPQMKCCFEVENLRNASPATVSRAGIIFVSDAELGWEAVLRGRLAARETERGVVPHGAHPLPAALQQQLLTLYCGDARASTPPKAAPAAGSKRGPGTPAVRGSPVPALWRAVSRDSSGGMATEATCCHLVVNSLVLVCAIAQEAQGEGREPSAWRADCTARVFWWSMAWAFGGMLEQRGRVQLDTAVRGQALRAGGPALPGEGCDGDTLFEYRISPKEGDWELWAARVPEWEYPGDGALSFSSLFIPTIDSTRLSYLLRCCFLQRRPVLLIGGSGTAKTVTISSFLAALPTLELGGRPAGGAADYTHRQINFSHATTPRMFYLCVEELIEKRVGARAFGPKRDRKLVLFVDDINMPEVNQWGDQVTNEIVRQVIDQGGYYSLDKDNEFKSIVDVTYWAAMSKPGGGKSDIPARLKSHFTTFCTPLPTDASLHQIYGALFRSRFQQAGYTERTQWVAAQLTPLSIEFWKQTTARMLPTPSKFHYLFSLRDLTNLCQGVLQSRREVFCGDPAPGRKLVPPADPEGLLARLWRHEATRVFSDKLNDARDKSWFDRRVGETMSQFLDINPWGDAEFVARLPASSYFCDFIGGAAEVDPETGDELAPARRLYQPVESVAALRSHLVRCLNEYNITEGKGRQLQLVLFDAAVKHVARIARVLGTPRGGMLLVGVGGSGKRSLTRLAASIIDYHTFQISASAAYGMLQFLDDLRGLHLVAGLTRPAVFLLPDTDIKEERFLEAINSFIGTGEVPGLWDKDPTVQEEVAAKVLPIARRALGARVEQTTEFLWAHFIGRVRDNLHLVLCFSPVGGGFRRRAREFPAIISTCVIDWFFPWPPEALLDVALAELGGYEIEYAGDAEGAAAVRTALLRVMAQSHNLMVAESAEYLERFRREVHATPRSYLSFVSSFRGMYAEKLQGIREGSQKIERGLDRLREAGVMIREMREQMGQQEREMADRKQEIAGQLLEVKQAAAVAEAAAAEVGRVRDAMSRDEAVVQQQQQAAGQELQAALPALAEARAAARDIQPADLKELQASSNNPASLTRVVLDGVLILLHYAVLHPVTCSTELTFRKRRIGQNGFIEPSWDLKGMEDKFARPPHGGGGKRFIANTDCVRMILDFTDRRKDHINPETCELLEPYLQLECFNGHDAVDVSRALGGLCRWVRAMVSYIRIARMVEPKMALVREMEHALSVAQRKLQDKQRELAAIHAEVAQQQKELKAKEDEQYRMEQEAAATARRTLRADELIASLSGERERWGAESERYSVELRRLAGDVVVCCAFVSYCGPFNSEWRRRVLAGPLLRVCAEQGLPVSPDAGDPRYVMSLLADERRIADWQQEGLPSDDHSIQNAAIVTRSLISDPPKYAFLIDPQGQGLQWLRQAVFPLRSPEADYGDGEGGGAGVVLLAAGDPKLPRVLTEQLSEGGGLIVDNVGVELDPLLDPVLDHSVQKRGRKPFITLQTEGGGTDNVDFNDNFRLFFVTRLPNPSLAPELFAKVAVVDFTVTPEGLEQQLLSEVIAQERSELGEERGRLVQQTRDNVKLLGQLEDRLLTQLSAGSTNLIDDEELVATLQENKRRSADIRAKQELADAARERIDAVSSEYRPVAARGSVLYFLITELSRVSRMYHTALTQFQDLFRAAMSRAAKHAIVQHRIDNIIAELTQTTFAYIDRGLFTRHKPLWSLLMACRVLERAGELPPRMLQMFLRAGAALRKEDVRPKPATWIADTVWLDVVAVSAAAGGRRLYEALPIQLSRHEADWRDWADLDAPEETPPPVQAELVRAYGELTPFDRLLLVRIFRGDRLHAAAARFVSETLGPSYAVSPQLDVAAVADSCTPLTPVIFLLSLGGDPTQMVHAMARRRRKHVRDVSLGEGQDAVARGLVQAALPAGDWTLLQNCHLSVAFLTSLEKQLAALAEGGARPPAVNPEARIWITSEPTADFPIGLLQMSIKLTNEPPAGIRAGMRRTFAAGGGVITQEMVESFRRPEWRPLLFALAFLHSLLQERRKFGPIGFCVPYEFNAGDLVASLLFLSNHFTQRGDDLKADRPGTEISYDTVRFMVAQIQYGGRVTDSRDARLLAAMVEHIVNPQLLSSGSLAPGYRLPVCEEVSGYRSFLDDPGEYPDTDSAAVFGLHANADIAYRTRSARELLAVLVSTQPKEETAGSAPGAVPREARVEREVARLEGELPHEWTTDELEECQRRLCRGTDLQSAHMLAPLTIHCVHEAQRLRACLGLLRRTLVALRLALAGAGALSPSLHAAMDSIADARAPEEWIAVSWPMAHLGPWWAHLLRRHEQIDRWLRTGRPSTYWLAGFYNPQGFLTCVAQEVARSKAGDWALADAVLRTEVTKIDDAEHPPQEGGVLLAGLWLDCAAWDRRAQRLRDPAPRAGACPMPCIHVTAESARKRRRDDRRPPAFACAVYRYPVRQDANWVFDCALSIAPDESTQHWVRRGVCLLCTAAE